MVRARARHRQPLVREQAESELVQLAVGRLALGYVLLALDERGRVENHHFDALAPLAKRLQGIEGGGVQHLERDTVALGVAPCELARRLRRADAGGPARAMALLRQRPGADTRRRGV